MLYPNARLHAMAEDNVHPVPWVLGLSILSPLNHISLSPEYRRSLAVFLSWPPLIRIAGLPDTRWLIILAARIISCPVSMLISERTSASGILGVIMSARGISLSIRVFTASSFNSLLPLVETITVSTTILRGLYCSSLSAIILISPESETIPILTASGKISVNTQSSCFPRNSGVTSDIPYTPVVFWAVSEVTALIPYTLWAAIVFKSACIPAPPLESLPAIVRTVFISSHFPLNQNLFLQSEMFLVLTLI